MTDGFSYVGGEAKLYYNGGSYGSPSWIEVENCQDLDAPDSRSSVAVQTRGQWPDIGYLVGSRDRSLTWGSVAHQGTSDAVLTALIAAYDNGTNIELAVADGDITVTGTKYRRAISKIFKADFSEPVDGAVTISFEAKPSINNSSNAPSRGTTA